MTLKPFHIKLLSIALIACTGAVAYSNTFHCSFHFDDPFSIIDNFAIRNILDLRAIWNFLPRRFILYFSLALNYHFNGLDVFGYHVFNLVVHLGSAMFVWWLVRLTLSTPAIQKQGTIAAHADVISLLTGLVFVSHPIQTQAVTYIVQRAASMATFFYVASLCFYVKSRLVSLPVGLSKQKLKKKFYQKPNTALERFYYICALAAAVAAMFTKEIAITLPLMILLYEFTFFHAKQGFPWRRCTPFLLTVFIIPITMLLTETGPARVHDLLTEPGISPGHYLSTQFRVEITYIRLLFLPFHQNVDYDYPISKSLLEWPTLLSFLCLLGVLFAAKRLFTKYRLVAFSIFWFFLTLVPESSILPIQDVIFEHRLYLPMVGFSLFLVSSAYYLFGNKSIKAMVTVLALLIASYTVLTFQRNKVWRSEFTLWDDAAQKSPHKARPYGNRGYEYYLRGDFGRALSDLDKAIAIKPNYAQAHNNRGIIYAKEGKLKQARADFTKAIDISPAYDRPYNNRGIVDEEEGHLSQAMADFTKAIDINPHYAQAYAGRAGIYEKQGQWTKAMADFNKAVAIKSDDAQAYEELNRLQKHLGGATISDFTKAIALDPKNAENYLNRGSLYAQQGQFVQAMADFDKALEIDPRNAAAYTDRGYVYAQQGQLGQAIANFTQAIAFNPKLSSAYNDRASMYFQLKEYDKAWADVKQLQGLGAAVRPDFINAIKKALAIESHGAY